MGVRLDGKQIALLVTDGFEPIELTSPKAALEKNGARTVVVSPKRDTVRGWNHTGWGGEFRVNRPIEAARAEDFDALVLPGGVMNPDKLRTDQRVQAFVRTFIEQGKPVAAICHGPWTLIDAGVVQGRQLTSYRSIRTDLQNAGASWVDQKVVVDNGLITSRTPHDLDAFNAALIEAIAGRVDEGDEAAAASGAPGGAG
jgi:protease I